MIALAERRRGVKLQLPLPSLVVVPITVPLSRDGDYAIRFGSTCRGWRIIVGGLPGNERGCSTYIVGY